MRSTALLLALLLLPATAWANGQTTHVWITEQALAAMPSGELGDLLRRPEVLPALLSGAMFPDGGYAVSDGYGEAAHWEPFQQAYLAWIRDEYGPDYAAEEAAMHVAFLMGLVSHGIADEIFDSRFMELSRIHDPGWQDDNAGLDTASDVLLAAAVGGVDAPEEWVPYEVLVGVFADDLGYEVSVDTLEQGQSLLFTALAYVEWARSTDERIEYFGGLYPWSQEHLLDETIPGSPPLEALGVAASWQATWERLHGQPFDAPVLEFLPGAGSFGHPLDSSRVDARLFATFGRGIDTASLAGSVRVVDADGAPVGVDVGLHYGNHSHALVVRPQQDWVADTDYVLEVGPGLVTYDGDEFEGQWSAAFSTRPPPEVTDEPTDCACAAQGAERPSTMGLLLVPAALLLRRRRYRGIA
jgi:hypothetical protein